MATERQYLKVYLDAEDVAELKEISSTTGASVTALIRFAVAAYLIEKRKVAA